MANSQDRVTLELIEAGDHKEQVIQVLAKVKGLNMSPEQIVNSTPCTIATNVPRHLAEKLQGFLEQVGAMVLIEGEDDLFSPEDLPVETEEDVLIAPPGDSAAEEEEEEFSEEFPPPTEEDWLADAFPQASSSDDDLVGDFQAAPLGGFDAEMDEGEEADYEMEEEGEEPAPQKSGKMSQLFSRFSKKEKGEKAEKRPKKKLSLPTFSLPKLGRSQKKEASESDTGAREKPSFFAKFRKTRSSAEAEPEEIPVPETGDTGEMELGKRAPAGSDPARLTPRCYRISGRSHDYGILGLVLDSVNPAGSRIRRRTPHTAVRSRGSPAD